VTIAQSMLRSGLGVEMIGPRAARIALVELIVAVMVATAACNDGGGRFPAPSTPDTGEGGGHVVDPQPSTGCTEGHTRPCHVVLGKQGTVVSCYDGYQECVDGDWGDCIDPTVTVTEPPDQL
jgi:hypothetical protein